tara:strand:- start:1626 stop:2357 length:732 start_codon:yes stop_codon:yes gene_type:complete
MPTEGYGVDISGYKQEDQDLFSKVTDQMRSATAKSTYAPFFQINQQRTERGFLSKLFSGGDKSGFAGSRNVEDVETQQEDDLGQSMLKLNENITQKIAQSQSAIDKILNENKQTAFQLKQIEAGEESDGDDGISVICTELLKQGRVSRKLHACSSLYGLEWLEKDADVYFGYLLWGNKVAKMMRKSSRLSRVVEILVKPLMNQMAYEVGGYGKHSELKHMLLSVMVKLCKRIYTRNKVWQMAY